MNKTIHYYNSHAEAFYERSISRDLSHDYKAFLKYLPKKASILDMWCGVGRDTKYFLEKGYKVTAFDASTEMVMMAQKTTGIDIMNLTFQEMSFTQEFDGIWANASLLHVSYDDTKNIYQKICNALKPQGIFYALYKYGNAYMHTDERDFWNMNEEKAKYYLSSFFDILEIWSSNDDFSKVAPSKDGKVLKFIARKK